MITAPGLLGMNRRNIDYILSNNSRKFYPLVDNKLLTKQLLEQHGIPCPMLYFEIKHNFELKLLRELKHMKEFVVKPARGSAGRGILPITEQIGKKWKTAKGELLSKEDVEYHVSNILAGLYSLGGADDHAFLEYYVRSHPIFRPISYQGVPDIRLIIYRGIPIISMLRLPTKESGGRANLHQGAVGAGLDMRDGITIGGVHRDRLIDNHPDTDTKIAGIRIPFWNDILEIGARLYDIFKLGYIGADFVIDQLLGPLILELNARPGLSIQLANREGLRPCLDIIDKMLGPKPVENELSPEKRLRIFREMLAEVNS
ncbi:MAG: alpha-L-glutamate ligase-like protein [Omnitrophica bacterium RIFCSPLOWO2_12_FULL_44_17]|uniref:Alpha-L-glutamate ligase-like protein n=1 Tax=Candidatus Danuiimicrobium aquiferis TaxID=1801832 RepID=A0A1G1L0Z4_9BACT|nr:MAG: alpha-L-glutamate ligase-like protein [Omnitrophica bacterium RIFCSPHIGHO2_02_FULL_45_28]OGW90462.1 MAG: alpha-L-glutamate ligase-like protein [Omnitrophica bacterium RIFCSPHIGHO2_12_FULL_44_12]OGW98847.1 MAG: alpha-L-glutamate ligase-like protein [Omnitrophica bacterium RIFCSPLOWO2_12_FULL_44_17]OGX02808.1 MAG: alpha-L-glutamate ligase-like protein [Omnitrophica bacterium RIFCSPLOWO2_02_FULL_44_11]